MPMGIYCTSTVIRLYSELDTLDHILPQRSKDFIEAWA